jgi:pyruvate dehydrogenase E2 component (dihydrolipoamide acetyltransferase)
MHVFELSFYATTIIYVLLYHPTAALIFAGFVGLYILIAACWPSLQSLSVRRKFALSMWPAPSEGLIYNNISLRVDRLLTFLSTIPHERRPTITHYVVKACGEVLKENPELNGKLIFGKFLPYETCDVSCLVNIDDGNDVGMMLVKDVPAKSVL